MLKSVAFAALVTFGLGLHVAPASALTTLTFGGPNVDPYIENGFSIDVARIVSGNCNVAPCMALNTNETSTLTRQGGGKFSLSSFWFQILGHPATLSVTSFDGATQLENIDLLESVYPHNNGGQTYSHLFDNVTSIVFKDTGRGNVRIDDIKVSTPKVSAVPVPAALPLFLTGLVGLGFFGTRKRSKAAHSL